MLNFALLILNDMLHVILCLRSEAAFAASEIYVKGIDQLMLAQYSARYCSVAPASYVLVLPQLTVELKTE